jgi:hypothetical protein
MKYVSILLVLLLTVSIGYSQDQAGFPDVSLKYDDGDFSGNVTVSGTLTGVNETLTGRLTTSSADVDSLLRNAGGVLTIADSVAVTGTLSSLKNIKAITTDSTMTTANFPSGSIVLVTGASEVTLPTAVAGIEYTFITVGTDSVIVLPGASDNIDSNAGADADNYCAAGVANEIAHVVAKDVESWVVLYITGTWGSY